jgi:hypothetical protein
MKWDKADRRQHPRFVGPFDGFRIGPIDTPVQVFDLSAGGCFVNATHEQPEGAALVLRINLPVEGWVRIEAETLYRRHGFGFAVRFTKMTDDDRARLGRALQALAERASGV